MSVPETSKNGINDLFADLSSVDVALLNVHMHPLVHLTNLLTNKCFEKLLLNVAPFR